jgi:hypothetical protein
VVHLLSQKLRLRKRKRKRRKLMMKTFSKEA